VSPDFGEHQKTLRPLRCSESWRIRLRRNLGVADVARLRRIPENATSTPLLRILALYEILWRLRKHFASSQLLELEKILFSLNTYRSSTTKGPRTAVLEHRRPSYSMNGRSRIPTQRMNYYFCHCVIANVCPGQSGVLPSKSSLGKSWSSSRRRR